jgi:hypothetical protein
MTRERTAARWASAWPDALAFALGLAVAEFAGWTTTDLVWSLWLSSLVVGYTMIVWTTVRPALDLARAAWRDRTFRTQMTTQSKGAAVVVGSILVAGGLFMLGFFTLHFGGFHYVHSQLLHTFFPIDGSVAGRDGMVGMETYLEVARRYWHFLPAAFIAERAGFATPPAVDRKDVSVTASAIAARKAATAAKAYGMVAPYRNVMRMHALIFFFAFAHLARLDTFAVYAVVYAVYFFPWRLIGRAGRAGQGPSPKGQEEGEGFVVAP